MAIEYATTERPRTAAIVPKDTTALDEIKIQITRVREHTGRLANLAERLEAFNATLIGAPVNDQSPAPTPTPAPSCMVMDLSMALSEQDAVVHRLLRAVQRIA